MAGEPLEGLVALVEVALGREPPEAQPVGSYHRVGPVALADVGIALAELGHLAGVEGVALQSSLKEPGMGGEEAGQVPPEEVGGLKKPQRISRAPISAARRRASSARLSELGRRSLADSTLRPTSVPAAS